MQAVLEAQEHSLRKPIRQFTSLKLITLKCLCGVKPKITLITSITQYEWNLSLATSDLYAYKT